MSRQQSAKQIAVKRLRRRGLANDLKARQQENKKTSFNAMAQNSGPVETHKGSYKGK